MSQGKTSKGPLLGIEQVCKLTGLSKEELQQLRIAGEFPIADTQRFGLVSQWHQSTIYLWKFQQRKKRLQEEVGPCKLQATLV